MDRRCRSPRRDTVNSPGVKSPQQVMLRVRFVEVSRTAGRNLVPASSSAGRDPDVRRLLRRRGARDERPEPRGRRARRALGTGVAAATSGTGGVPFANIIQRSAAPRTSSNVFISALETRGVLRRLAEPNLIAISGRARRVPGRGGEYPIPVANQTFNGSPQVTVSYKEFGVKLAFTPTVMRNGTINLQLEPEVSQIDPTLSVAVGGGVSVPGLSKRRARTNVELRDGQSFAIAGLLQTQSSRTIDQLPWLGSLPVLGALSAAPPSRTTRPNSSSSSPPALVNPAKPGQVLASPPHDPAG